MPTTGSKRTPRARAKPGAAEAPPRVFLRKPTQRDRDEYTRLARASHEFWRRFGSTPPGPPPPDASRDVDGMIRANREGRNVKMFACRVEDGAILGVVNLNEIVRGAFHSAYLGYRIGKPFARRGYMTEALRLAVAYAFDTLGLHRVEANIVPTNRASLALVRRVGFRREGLSPRYLRIAGRWQDHERWALLADERPRGRGPR